MSHENKETDRQWIALQKEAEIRASANPALSPAILKGEEKTWTPTIATDEQAVGILKALQAVLFPLTPLQKVPDSFPC